MRTRNYCSSIFAPFSIIVYAFFFFITTFSYDSHSPDDQSACELNFTRHPYCPSGYCINHLRKINYWGSIPSTLCCENALITFSQALAQRARNPNDTVFLQEGEWKNCNTPFLSQKSVSIQSCGIDKFYYGSSKCSSLSVLSTIDQLNKGIKDGLSSCYRLNVSFNDACAICSEAIVGARDNLLEELRVREIGSEKAICGLAVVISVAAMIMDDQALDADDLFSCLGNLNDFDPGYVKLKGSIVKAVIAILIALTTIILVFALIKVVTLAKRKNEKRRKGRNPNDEMSTTWSGLYRFTKAEIENAIYYNRNKTETKYLGRGSAGQVYKGILPSGQVVAVKHIDKSNRLGMFVREVEGMSKVRHRNLVCLLGCCVEGGEYYLVYEYCSAGNLAEHLLRKDSVLTWESRVKILRDCALALKYLHHYIDGCIVHRDIKLTNILLTENLEAKVSDFGLAKMLDMEESKVFTDVRGTIGYMDPEYMINAKLTSASDIYSFGIVALQILSGQKVIDLDLDARDQLTRKAKDVSLGKRPMKDFEDPRLNGNINMAEFESILQMAVLCVSKSSKGRPTIDVIFDEIDRSLKNTVAEMVGKTKEEQLNSSRRAMSGCSEVIPV